MKLRCCSPLFLLGVDSFEEKVSFSPSVSVQKSSFSVMFLSSGQEVGIWAEALQVSFLLSEHLEFVKFLFETSLLKDLFVLLPRCCFLLLGAGAQFDL